MFTPLIMPDSGSAQAFFSLWHVAVGERVRLGERIAEVLIPGAVIDISAPVAGVLLDCRSRPGEGLRTGQVIGTIASESEVPT